MASLGIPAVGIGHIRLHLVAVEYTEWLYPYPKASARATDERTVASHQLRSQVGVGHERSSTDDLRSLNEADSRQPRGCLANLNSICPWTLRLGLPFWRNRVNMSYFIIKQLPILPPEAFLEEGKPVGLPCGTANW